MRLPDQISGTIALPHNQNLPSMPSPLPRQWSLLIGLFLALVCLPQRGVAGIRDYGLKPYVRVSRDLPHVENQPWKLVCELPRNSHFQPWIEVTAEAGKELRFNSSNPLVLYLTETESCPTTAGRHSYEAKNWVSGEGAIYTIPAGVTVHAVQFRETGYDTTLAGSFVCNDNDYNILWQKAARTAYICMRDHFYDCPDRERVGFWGDGTPELDQCFYLFDTSAHELCKELVVRPLEPKFYPGQHLEFLGEYGLWFYYLQTGDLASLRQAYEPARKFLFDTYQFGKHGTWFDWGKENKDTAVIETCFYFNCLETLAKIARAIGREADLPAIEQKLAEIRSTFDAKYWQGGYYRSSQVKEPDDRANAMAVNSGLADRTKWPAIYENVLLQKTYASCFFDRWVFAALCKMGKPDRALLRMAQRYQTMIPCSFTTLWEHYDRWWASHIDAYDDASSLNHGWNPPALILSQTIAGVTPVSPGWNEYQVLPQEAFLTSLKVEVPSIKGRVTVDIQKTSTQYALKLISPSNTTAIVGIPRIAFSRLAAIQANHATVWDGRFHDVVPGVSWVGEGTDYVKFRVRPGTWEFAGLGTLPLTTPKTPAVPQIPLTPLEKRDWIASASIPDGSFPFSGAKIPIDIAAANALDGDHWTGWRDMTQTQVPGQWFQVDMRKAQSFNQIVLDNTWALWDSPEQYSVTVSKDALTWSPPVATGSGKLGITTITFPKQTARYIRVTQTGTNAKYHWSIYEFDACLTSGQ